MEKETALFNEKTIKRLCSKTKITAKQKKATKSWIGKLEADSLKRERAHYLEFNDSILRDLLGYDDVKFEEEDVEFSANDSTGKRGICFEVKGTKTKDLFAKQPRGKKEHETPVKQLWDYMSKDATPFGIITNYRIFILFDYSKGQSRHHQFDFLDIKNNEDKLKEFISIFSKDSILEKKFVEELYKQSVIEEKEFTKEFYKLFHETRLMLIEEFKSNEELADAIKTPIHFAQLYLNRLMFILFAEDTGKLPPRVFEERILNILKSEGIVSDHSTNVSNTIRDLFISVDKGATTPDKIFGFNGGLFEASIPNKIYFKDIRDKKVFNDVYQHSQLKKEIKLDEDSQKILNTHGDKLNPLIKNLLLMAAFDFNTEVNVNILGHIFEHSITDIEALQEGDTSRRKKEGVYYTPEFVTDYICRNTILPYLSKNEAKTARDLVLEYTESIGDLEKKFQEIKIVDPACGSGAFLIKAVDVLLEIHKEIQLFKQDKGAYTALKKGLKVKKDVGQLMLGKWVEEDEARTIIENNIFGVDINEESIEITKLSLFLKIAKKNKKLINLSKNIKCGNSLIENEEVAGEKAFSWNNEFTEIFDKGGFDIVIGNPPYVRQEDIKELKPELEEHYKTYNGTADLYVYFFERAQGVLRDGGYFGFISSNKFMVARYGDALKKFLSDNTNLKKLIDFGDLPVFEDVTTYPAIFITKKTDQRGPTTYVKIPTLDFNSLSEAVEEHGFNLPPEHIDGANWKLRDPQEQAVINKLENIGIPLKDYSNVERRRGILTGFNEAFIIDRETRDRLINSDKKSEEIIKPFISGENVKRYEINFPDEYLIFTRRGIDIDSFTAVKEHLEEFKEKLMPKPKNWDVKINGRWKGRKPGPYEWYEIQDTIAYYNEFEKPKIVYPEVSKNASFSFDEDRLFTNKTAFILSKKDIFLVTILNSKILEFYLHNISSMMRGGYYMNSSIYVNELPVRPTSYTTPKDERNKLVSEIKDMYAQSNFTEILHKIESYLPKDAEGNFIVEKEKSDVVHDFLEFLGEGMIEKNKKKQVAIKSFLSWLESYIEIKVDDMNVKTKVKEFYSSDVEWEDYYKILKKSKKLTDVNIDDFEAFNALKKAFDSSREKLIPLMRRIEETDDLINKIVYTLYGLTDEEIRVVEENV